MGRCRKPATLRGRPWTPASLRAVGGIEGVGATFLEETFSAAGAPPEHRYHQKAARAVLKALLPESGTDIKGHMRSSADLVAVSGHASRPRDFEELIRHGLPLLVVGLRQTFDPIVYVTKASRIHEPDLVSQQRPRK